MEPRNHQGTRRWLTAVAAVCLVAACLQARQPAAEDPLEFRSRIDLVSLNATVLDGRGHYVTDLNSNDFTVFEDGIKQDVSVFARTPLPIGLVVLLDTSASMNQTIKLAQDAAIGFVHRLRPEDLGAVIGFSARVNVLQGFTSDQAALDDAIHKTAAGGTTSMYTGIYVALRQLEGLRRAQPDAVRRHAIILLSDGDDTASLLPFDEVLNAAKRSDTVMYTIELREPPTPGSPRTPSQGDFVIRQFAQATGGRAFSPTQASELHTIYAQIAEELSNQYMLGYTSTNRAKDGQWRRLSVRANKPSTIVRTRQGYFGPTREP